MPRLGGGRADDVGDCLADVGYLAAVRVGVPALPTRPPDRCARETNTHIRPHTHMLFLTKTRQMSRQARDKHKRTARMTNQKSRAFVFRNANRAVHLQC